MLETLIFVVFGLAAVVGAVLVVVNQDVSRMAFWLIVSLGSVAGLFFMLGADFVGAAQLLIYVGGTVVLLIFGVMLTGSGPYLKIKSNPGEQLQAGLLGLLVLGVLLFAIVAINWDVNESRLHAEFGGDAADSPGYNQQGEGTTVRSMGTALLGARFDKDLKKPEGEPLSSGYLLPFEIISIHLLVVLIGASYLARAKRRAGSETPGS